jgi:hypothetical protein
VWSGRLLDDLFLRWLVTSAIHFHGLGYVLVLKKAAISQEALNCTLLEI